MIDDVIAVMRMTDDIDIDAVSQLFKDKMAAYLQGGEEIKDLVNRITLSEDIEANFRVDGKCERIIVQGHSIASNHDRPNSYGMRFYCHNCFSKEDHSDSNIKIFKNHGVCQNISKAEYINKEAQHNLIQEVKEGSNKDTFESFKKRLGELFVVFFQSVPTLCSEGKEELAEAFFQQITEQLTTLCKSFASMSYLIKETLTSTSQSIKGNLNSPTILEEYFRLNSLWECLPTDHLAVLFTFMTLYDDFNRLTVELIFKYFVETYTLNSDDSRMYYYQLILKMISFDRQSMAGYIQSAAFVTFLTSLRKACEEYYCIDEMKNREEMNDLTVFIFNQLQLLFDNSICAVALTTCQASLQAYMALQLSFQDIELLDYSQDSYYTYDISNFNTIVNSHDALLLTYSMIIHRLWKTADRQSSIANCLKHVIKFVVDDYQPSVMKTNRLVSFVKPAQRIFAIGVMALCVSPAFDTQGREDPQVSFDKDMLDSVMKLVFKDNKQSQQFFTKTFREAVRCQGFCSEISRQMWAKFGDDEMQDMLYDYMKTNFTLFDADIVFLKIAMLYVSDQELNNMYKYFCVSQNFQKLFDADPMNLYLASQEDWFEKMFMIYKDFWTFINYLMVDEVSIANLSIYALDQEEYLNVKYKYMRIFDTAKEFARSAVYCLGSCNASKLNDTAFWYFPYRTPFLKLVDDELEFDSRTFIFRLNKEQTEYTAKHLKLEIFNRNISVASEVFSKLDERHVNSQYMVTECRPCKHQAGKSLVIRLIQRQFVKDIFSLFNSYLVQNSLSEQLLPIFLRLTNNFAMTLASIRADRGSLRDDLTSIFKQSYVHKWSQAAINNRLLAGMIDGVRRHVDDAVGVNVVDLKDTEMEPSKEGQGKEEGEKKTSGNEAQKKKMEEKLAKMKSKMKKRQNEVLMEQMIDGDDPKKAETMDLEKPGRKEYPERLENTCCFCLAKIEDGAESTYFTYMRLTNKVASEGYYPLISGCGHALHKSCFNDFKQKTKKIKNSSFAIQLACLQCKLLSNSFICKKSAFIDVDHLKATLSECQSHIADRTSGSEVDSRLTLSLAYFIDTILADRHRFMVSTLMASYLDVYSLLTDHWFNVVKQSTDGRPVDAAVWSTELIDVDLKHKTVVTALLELKSQPVSMEETFCRIARAMLDDHCLDQAGAKIAAFLTFVVNKKWITYIDEKCWDKLTSMSNAELTEDFLMSQVFKCQDQFLQFNQDSSKMLVKRPPCTDSTETQPKPFDVIRKYKKFVNLVNEYGKLGCSKCGCWPKELSKCLLVCLTCQYRVCKSLCDDLEHDDDGVQESLNEIEHALAHHGGSCVYISLYTGALHLVDSPLSKFS